MIEIEIEIEIESIDKRLQTNAANHQQDRWIDRGVYSTWLQI